MAEVTVCVPAFRAEAFIHHALGSVQRQTFDDFEVQIAIEPTGAERTLAACAPFLRDDRFRATVNPEVLGYAGNVRALLERVRSPLFVVLPHDDAWHPRFIERLHAVLRERPDAVCAYPDLLCFAPDSTGSGIVKHLVSDAGLAERVTSWFLDGASGNIWHGLTRALVLGRAYPDNQYRGFAAEVEWALHLVAAGPVLRVTQPLYLKRTPTVVTPDSVSASWLAVAEDLPAALEHHRERLLAAIPDELSAADRIAAQVAAEAAMLRRHQEFASGRWGLNSQQLQRAADVLEAARRFDPVMAARLRATVEWALSRHWQALGDLAAAEKHARDGLLAVEDDPLLCSQLARLLLARGEVSDAIDVALSAHRAHPDDWAVRMLVRHCDSRLEQDLRPVQPPATQAAVVAPTEAGSGGPPFPEAEARIVGLEADQARLSERLGSLAAQSDELRRRVGETEALVAAVARKGAQPQWRASLSGRGRRQLARLGLPNPLFDAAWYRETYRDVPRGPLRAWLHWRRRGWRDGRDPSPLFDTDWYLAANPDVRATGMDPLLHYLLHGSAEGRDPGPNVHATGYR